MQCDGVQEWLLQAEGTWPCPAPAEVAGHLRQCGQCSAYAARLRRLEQAVRELPVPAGAAAAKDALLSRLGSGAAQPVRAARPWRSWAVSIAALFIVGLVGGLWLLLGPSPESAEAATVVDSVADWNIQLAELPSVEERTAAYTRQAPAVRTRIQRASIRREDREIAERLLQNASYLARSADPAEEAERFSELEGDLTRRVREAAGKKDEQKVRRLARLYARLAERGVNARIERMERLAKADPERARSLKGLLKRRQESEQVFLYAARQMRGGSRPDLDRALQAARRPGKARPTSRRSD